MNVHTVTPEVERQARAMTKAERRAYLRDHGWTSIGSSWHHPTFVDPDDRPYVGSKERRRLREAGAYGDMASYSLAAAIRTALTEEHKP